MKNKLLLLALLAFGTAMSAQGSEKQDSAAVRTAYLVCNAHLDTQWNWDVQTTIREYIPRTLRQNLYLMKRYPDYRFSFEGGIKYAWMKEYYPEYYEELKERIKSGQWHIAGASWDATDTNIPSAESMFRNILLGQEFYRKEFGVKSTDIFLPDCFGFGYALPSIAAHCGLIGMSTQKLSWRNNDFYDAEYHRKNPFSWGVWKGIDGQSVIAAFDTGSYNAEIPEDVQNNKRLVERAEHGFDNTCYKYYSGGGRSGALLVGDMGNSGTVLTCRRLEKALNDKWGAVRIISAVSDDLFRDNLHRKDLLPSFDGELLMDVHGTGCYTSQTAMKYYNRRNESLAGAAEVASVSADWLGLREYNTERMNEIWGRFIWHQFHDDLTGTSIPQAYGWSWNDELLCLRQSGYEIESAAAALAPNFDTRGKGIPVIVYNPVARDTKRIAEVNLKISRSVKNLDQMAAYGPDGKVSPVQVIERNGEDVKAIFVAEVPSAGFAVYDIRMTGRKAARMLKAGGNKIENDVCKVTLNESGDVVSIYDKRNSMELVQDGRSFRMAVTQGNESHNWPAWEVLKEAIDKEATGIDGNVKISVAENGPVRASLKVEKTFGDSRFIQYISLTDGCDLDGLVEFRTAVDWNQENCLLKAEFPMSVSNPRAAYDLGLGHILRGNNTVTAYEVPAHKWADLTGDQYGVTILSDCKYGWDKPSDNLLRLTLIHTPGVSDRYTHQKNLDKGINCFRYAVKGHAGNDYSDACASAEEFDAPLLCFTAASRHNGVLGKKFSFASSSNPNLAIRAIKKAEDGDGYIVRCYNVSDSDQEGELRFASDIASAELCNGIEEILKDASFSGNKLSIKAGRFAPITVRIRLAESRLASGNKLVKYGTQDRNVNLPFNSVAFSTDEFQTYFMFDKDRGTYAAELIPQTIECKGVKFEMGEENYKDVVLCSGETVAIPQGYKKLYMLVAATENETDAEFSFGEQTGTVHVGCWKGFYGQWGWRGYSEGFLKDDVVAYIGTHKHKGDVGNVPYDFSYMYMVELDIPEGATSVTLPKDRNVAVFAITVSDGHADEAELCTDTFIRPDMEFGQM